ncbi:MAG TPA: hypothetical protein VFI41_12650 [Gemmatimonadales bacterium]|nr:hypothetical protein [Gemmatimonadales bacterium]
MIRKTKKGYEVVSKKSKKRLSKPNLSLEQAKRRLRQIEYFKHLGK